MEINVPDNATNGDMIKAMFPDCEVNEHKVQTNSQGALVVGYDVFLYAYHPNESDIGLGFGIKIFFDNMWWNAPYKTEIEKLQPIKPQEPCEDAISRQAVNTLIDELARAISDERGCISRGRSTATIMRDILHLPPVNPQNCDNCEIGNPCLYCRHEFEPQKRSDEE